MSRVTDHIRGQWNRFANSERLALVAGDLKLAPCLNAVLIVVAAYLTCRGVGDVGWTIGWLGGASKTPAVHFLIPVVAGLVTGGLMLTMSSAVLKFDFHRICKPLVVLVVAGYLTIVFVNRLNDGIEDGIIIRQEAANKEGRD